MICVTDKKECCGCESCVQRCPKHCISLTADDEGFRYPVADAEMCISCGLCESVCPVLGRGEPRQPQAVLAVKNRDEAVRGHSSSGGVFTALAEQTLKAGGVVFGAMFDAHWDVVHGYAETTEGLAALRGAKYAQSHVGDAYARTEAFLRQGRKVLFSGTPCQVAGLRKFLRKDYEGLLAVETFCHSVPSPGQWQVFLAELCKAHGKTVADISGINFRDKSTGWKNYSFSVTFSDGTVVSEPHDANPFMKAFISGLITRPSCYACPAKELRSGADITIGDLWGITAMLLDFDDDRGASAVLANTPRGVTALASLPDLETRALAYADVCRYNPALVRSATPHPRRADFFAATGQPFSAKAVRYTRPPLPMRLRLAAGRLARVLLPKH